MSTLAKVLSGILLAALLFGGGYWLGHHNGGNATQVKCQATTIVSQEKVIQQDNKVATAAAVQASDSQAIGVAVQNQTEQSHETVKRIIVKVPVYVPAAADSNCTINAGFVRVWNAANSGTEPAAEPASAPGGQQPSAESAGAGDLSAAQAFSLTPEQQHYIASGQAK